MELYEAIDKRRTVREFLYKEVDFEVIKRILEAGNKASKELNGEYVSKLNPFSTIWCVIENIFLAATSEGLAYSMRIPLNEEHDIVKEKLKIPPTYMIPVFIGIGYANPSENTLEQNVANLDKQIHFGRWK